MPLRAGVGRPPPAARARGGRSSPSASRYGSSAAPLAQRHPGALAPVRDQRVERRGVGPARRRPAARRRSAVAGGTAAALVPQAARRARRRVAAPRRPRPPVRRPPARRRRPPGVVAAARSPAPLVSRRVRVGRRAGRRPGAARRRRAPARRRPRLRRRACGRACVAEREPGAAAARASRRGPAADRRADASRRYRRRRDAAAHRRHRRAWRAHVDRRRPPHARAGARRQGQRLRVRARPARRDRRRARRHDRRRHGARARPTCPAGVTAVVLTPTLAAAGRHRADPHRRLGRPRRAPSPAGRAGCSSSWRRRCAASARPSTTSAPSRAAARAAGLDIVGFSVHPPVAGTDDEHLDDIAAWLDVLEPDDEVWVSHLSPDGYGDLRDGWPDRRFRIRLGTALWHGDKRGPPPRRRRARRPPGPRRRARRLPPAARCRVDGRLVMVGAGTAHGVHPLADGRSPFHFARRRLALLEPPHMHTSMVARAGRRAGPRRRRRRRRAAPADLHVSSTRCAGDERSARPRPPTEPSTRDRRRLPGPDVVRAVALIGVVVMNFHGYLILRGGDRGDGAARPLLRPVDRAAVDPLRGHVRARRRRRRDAAHPRRRSATRRRRRRHAAGRSSAAASRSTAAGCCST